MLSNFVPLGTGKAEDSRHAEFEQPTGETS